MKIRVETSSLDNVSDLYDNVAPDRCLLVMLNVKCFSENPKGIQKFLVEQIYKIIYVPHK